MAPSHCRISLHGSSTTMPKDSRLRSYHRFPLHVLHAFLAVIVVLFLILGSVSGPTTNYWWMTVEYSDNANGTTWNLGGLGSCQVGQK
jgi:hypothetical protein